LKIKVRNNNVNTALRMLKRKTKEDLALLKDREYFEKPSEIRNQAKQAAKLREKRRQEKQKNDKNKQF
jgi:ribosomal protein S21